MRRIYSRSTRENGNVLPFIVATTAILVVALLVFGLRYIRLLGGYQEQRTAIDAAALAAAKELSRVVIEDPDLGFVSLSDAPPIGKSTIAGDNFYMPVRGINSILATIRLDLIIADLMQDPIMKQCALNDYQSAMRAKDSLTQALKQAMQSGGQATDYEGKVIDPVWAATQAYSSNQVNINNGGSSMVPNSLKLTLGYIDNLRSNMPVAQPASAAGMNAKLDDSGYYKANTDIPYDGASFVFAALGDGNRLVDQLAFRDALPSVPYSIPTVVKCEADERYDEPDGKGGSNARVIHAAAAAEIGSSSTKHTAPGALTLTMLGGPAPEINTLGALFTQSQIAESPCDLLQTPLAGDYPETPLSPMVVSGVPLMDPSHPKLSEMYSMAFYDWLKRSGPYLNMQSLMTTLQMPLKAAPDAGVIHQFQVAPDGQIDYKTLPITQTNLAVSQNQWRAVSGLAFTSTNKKTFDVILTDFVSKEGRMHGGKHGGEPLDWPGETRSYSSVPPRPSFIEDGNWPYHIFLIGPPDGAPRPSYQETGIAVDFTLRERLLGVPAAGP